jgi:hypothetical protein
MADRRYVILHHKTPGGEHWDLMLERDDALATWQLDRVPAGRGALPLPATRIFDHRKMYLDYEGPISGDRGSVTRLDHGQVDIQQASTDRWVFDLTGQVFAGRFCLVRIADMPADRWEFAAC